MRKKKLEENRIIPDRGKRYCAAVFFPNRYEVAIANLGFHWLYRSVNEHPLFWGERFTLDSSVSIDGVSDLFSCDLILLSVSFENDLLNIINFFNYHRIPLFSRQRGKDFPPVIMGGAVTFFNPFPFLKIVDAIVLGEGEEKLSLLLNSFADVDGSKSNFIDKLSQFEWIVSEEKQMGRRLPVFNLQHGGWSVFFSERGEFGKSFLIEIQRGCTHLCRFCGAGYTYLPPRFFDPEILFEIIETWSEGIDKIGLISPSPSDHPMFWYILEKLIEKGKRFSLSSIRPDFSDKGFFELLSKGGPDSLTLAPEAGSEEERRILNKNIPDDLFFNFVENAGKSGIKKIKLYFIIGRQEGMEEIDNILNFLKNLKNFSKGMLISASFSIFVPKPFTPFQWKSMNRIDMVEEKITKLKRDLISLKVKASFENLYDAFAEGLIARSDETLLEKIKTKGKVSPKRIVLSNIEMVNNLLLNQFDFDYDFPWKRISTSLSYRFLVNEAKRSINGKITAGCIPGKCRKCGVCN